MELATGRRDLSKPGDPVAWMLFFLGGAICLTLLLADLEAFPIYFFSDEAIHPVEFQRLKANHWRAVEGPHELLPAYFKNVLKFNLSFSVYAQGLFELVAGRSPHTIRLLSVLGCFSASVAVALLLRRAQFREWWVALPVFACAPGWFLHARTGFEVTMMVMCYGWFLFFYYCYLTGAPAAILPAMLCGAGTFYSYSNGQGLMLFSALALLVLHRRQHWERKAWAASGLILAVLLFLPYVRFRLQHPGMMEAHLNDIESYLNEPGLPLSDKLLHYARYYFYAMSPGFWFRPGVETIQRHDAVGFAHVSPLLLAPVIVGLGITIRHWRKPWATLLLAAWAAGPVTAALAGIGLNRVLAMIFPLMMLAVLGFDWLGQWLKHPAAHTIFRGALAAGLLFVGASYQADILARAPTQFQSYGLHGLQWGAQAIFRDCLPRLSRRLPEARLFVTHSWANNPNVFAPYFGFAIGNAPGEMTLVSLDQMISTSEYDVRPGDIVVMTREEHAEMAESPAIEKFVPLQRIRYPNGEIGFHVGHLVRRADFEKLTLLARRAKAIRFEGEVLIDGLPVQATLAGLDGGTTLKGFFEGTGGGVARCVAGVPLEARLVFPSPQRIRSVEIVHWDNGIVQLKATARLRGEVVATLANALDFQRAEPRRQTWDLAGREVDAIEIEGSSHPIDLVHLRNVLVHLEPAAKP